jgi:hypothetical protein
MTMNNKLITIDTDNIGAAVGEVSRIEHIVAGMHDDLDRTA